jgi:thioredoxin-like negative regulator of GroEL
MELAPPAPAASLSEDALSRFAAAEALVKDGQLSKAAEELTAILEARYGLRSSGARRSRHDTTR